MMVMVIDIELTSGIGIISSVRPFRKLNVCKNWLFLLSEDWICMGQDRRVHQIVWRYSRQQGSSAIDVMSEE